MFREKKYKHGECNPSVSVIIVGDNAEEKIRNIRECDYSDIEILTGNYENATKANGEIIIFTDTKTRFDKKAIKELIKPFADERIGAVVGQLTNPEGNSAFWKYENLVKKLESRIGCVSGANESIFAVRKCVLPQTRDSVLNNPFYIVTKIIEYGKAVVFRDTAKAYEEKQEGTNFHKHVMDAAGYWQALKLFPKMFFFGHGSFVYIGHRVMKWFVWLNMLLILLTSMILAFLGSIIMLILFVTQVFGYLMFFVLGKKNIRGVPGKLIGIGYYFIMLNMAYFVGIFKRKP